MVANLDVLQETEVKTVIQKKKHSIKDFLRKPQIWPGLVKQSSWYNKFLSIARN